MIMTIICVGLGICLGISETKRYLQKYALRELTQELKTIHENFGTNELLKTQVQSREIVDVVSDASTDTVLFADMPTKVQLKVTYTEPGIKGDTATNTLKPATVETGAEVRVPLFINEGEVIEINTTDGSYVGRIRE